MFLSSSAHAKSGYQRYINNLSMANTSLELAFTNQTTSSTVYAYVTGQAIQNNNAIILLKSDGSYYFPTNPPAIGSPLTENCAIQLGPPGSTKNVTIPQIAGGRIWFSIDSPLTFFLNPGPALVEPSVTNPSDPNINISWGFCEFTFNESQLFANISYVDFVSLPIALTLTSSNAPTQTVTGTPSNGLETVCNGLIAQTAADGRPWSNLIVRSSSGTLLRALSPNNGILLGANFTGYYEPFVSECYSRFTSTDLNVDTQAGFGIAHGRSNGISLQLSGQSFPPPSTADIFSCSTGPFATGQDPERNAIIPRLAAAFNRSTLLTATSIPATASSYYQQGVTNHYARIVHAANVDGIGYAFPYDDVTPTNGPDQSGKVESGTPTLFTITVGGGQWGNINRTVVAEPPVDAVAILPGTIPAPQALQSMKSAEAAQKPLGQVLPASTAPVEREDIAAAKAAAASQGPTATPVEIKPAPGPGVAPYPTERKRKRDFLKRAWGKLRGKK